MSYKVTDTRQVDQMSQAGSVVKMYRVWLVTGRGAAGQVDVPLDKWNPVELLLILTDKAAELDLAFTVSE